MICLPEAEDGEEESLGELHDDCFVSFVCMNSRVELRTCCYD